jgi:hypothetical protein
MKSTQAWGWLAAAVLAAGLNAAYHYGGLAWAHRIVYQARHVSGAVVALASGHADQFLSEAETLTARNDEMTAFSQSARATANQEMARAEAAYARAEARQQAHCARMQAEHARMEARIASHGVFVRVPDVRVETFRTIQIPEGPAIRLPRIELSQVKAAHCSRIRVRVPAMPDISVPAAPAVNVSFASESDE